MRTHRWSNRLLHVARSMIVFSSQGLIFPVAGCVAIGIIPQPDQEPGGLATPVVGCERDAPSRLPRQIELAPA